VYNFLSKHPVFFNLNFLLSKDMQTMTTTTAGDKELSLLPICLSFAVVLLLRLLRRKIKKRKKNAAACCLFVTLPVINYALC
jgi:hypothetical protein